MTEKERKLDTSPYKGVRDFYPEEAYIENYIFSIWKKVSERFGYEEYNASILEPSEIFKEKSGEEIVNEQTFTFVDRGGREVTLRPEMTPTLARMIAAKRRDLGFPLRWYSIPNLFRYETTQRGRLREHWQLNADIFGVDNQNAELEIIALANEIMLEFGAKQNDFEIRLNSNSTEKKDLFKLIENLKSLGISNTKVNESLARGQTYYTGTVFEFFDTNPENSRSILGGGRYDNLTSLFGDKDLPAVGFGAGDVTMRDFMETHNLLPKYIPATKLCIIPSNLNLAEKALLIATDLRKKDMNVAVDWSEKKVGDKIKTADKHQIPYIMVFGEDEINSGKYKLKEMKSGKETETTIEEIPSFISNNS